MDDIEPIVEYPIPQEFQHIIAKGENYIYHGELTSGANQIILVLTDKKYHKLYPQVNQDEMELQLKWSHDLNEICGVEKDIHNPRRLLIHYRPPAKKLSFTDLGEHFYRTRTFEAVTSFQVDEWLLTFQMIIRSNCQEYFEADFIPEPEFYQGHLIVNKLSKKGKIKLVLLLLSNSNIYNIEIKLGNFGKTKWILPIEGLTEVVVYETPSNLISFTVQNMVAPKVPEKCYFLTKSKQDVDQFAMELQRLSLRFRSEKIELKHSTWTGNLPTENRLKKASSKILLKKNTKKSK